MLRDLLPTVKLFLMLVSFLVLAIENRFECPEIFMTHHSAEVLFRCQQGRGCPAFGHRFVPPSANAPGATSNSGMRVLDQIRAGQAAMQRGRHIQPIDGETFFHAFPQTISCVGMLSSQPLRQFLQLRHTRLGIQFQAARISDLVCSC